jgi:hypothetical protein
MLLIPKLVNIALLTKRLNPSGHTWAINIWSLRDEESRTLSGQDPPAHFCQKHRQHI